MSMVFFDKSVCLLGYKNSSTCPSMTINNEGSAITLMSMIVSFEVKNYDVIFNANISMQFLVKFF